MAHAAASGSKPPPTEITGWIVGWQDGALYPKCSNRRGCVHAPSHAEYCTLDEGASDDDADDDEVPPAALQPAAADEKVVVVKLSGA
jgi:hypothetical protein